MTYTTSSEIKIGLHAFWQAIRQNLALLALGFIGFILLIPVAVAGFNASSIFNTQYTSQIHFLFCFFPESNKNLIYAGAILYGLALGIFVFKFMLSKKSANVYFSLGISRSKQFLLRFLAGALMLIVPITTAMTVSLFLNISAFGYSMLLFSSWLYLTLGFNILGLVTYATAALVCTLTGTIFEGIVYTAAVLGAPSMVLFGLNALMKLLLYGNAFNAMQYSGNTLTDSLVFLLKQYNPLLFFFTQTTTYSFCQGLSIDKAINAPPPINHALLTGWFIVFLLISVVSVYAFKRRRAEIAGNMGENRAMNFIVTFVVAFFGFGAVISLYNKNGNGGDVLSSLLLGAATFVAVYAVAEFILKRTLKPFIKGLVKLPAHLGIVMIVVIILSTGGLGFSSRIPAIADIKSAEMSYLGTPNYHIDTYDGWCDDVGNYQSTYSYSYTTSSDLKLVEALHGKIIRSGVTASSIKCNCVVKYNLKSGGAILRYYSSVTPAVAKKMLGLDNTEAVKKSVSDNLSGQKLTKSMGNQENYVFKSGKIYLSNSWYTNPYQANLDSTQRAQLMQCIDKDVSNQTLDDRYYPANPPLGVIMFTSSDSDKKAFRYNNANSKIYVTDQFSNTIDFLKQNNLYSIFDFSGGFDSIEIQKHHTVIISDKSDHPNSLKNTDVFLPRSLYFMSCCSSGTKYTDNTYKNDPVLTTADAQQISQLALLLRDDYFTDEDGYLATVKIKGTNNYVYKFLPAANAPQFVKDAAK